LELRLRFALQALERPTAAAFDFGRHAGQRDERSEFAAPALELEGRDVMLDAVVVSGQRRRSAKIDRPVGADQPGARLCRTRALEQNCRYLSGVKRSRAEQ